MRVTSGSGTGVRGAPGVAGTIVLNVLFGWSVLGWGMAMIRAFAIHPTQLAPSQTLIVIPNYGCANHNVIEAGAKLVRRGSR